MRILGPGRLCELNVERQLYNVCTSPTVQAAWDRGQPLSVHAYVYSLSDGLLKVCLSLDICSAT